MYWGKYLKCRWEKTGYLWNRDQRTLTNQAEHGWYRIKSKRPVNDPQIALVRQVELECLNWSLYTHLTEENWESTAVSAAGRDVTKRASRSGLAEIWIVTALLKSSLISIRVKNTDTLWLDTSLPGTLIEILWSETRINKCLLQRCSPGLNARKEKPGRKRARAVRRGRRRGLHVECTQLLGGRH